MLEVGNVMFGSMGRFNNYTDAAKFIFLVGECKKPISVNQIKNMLKTSKNRGLTFLGDWYAK